MLAQGDQSSMVNTGSDMTLENPVKLKTHFINVKSTFFTGTLFFITLHYCQLSLRQTPLGLAQSFHLRVMFIL